MQVQVVVMRLWLHQHDLPQARRRHQRNAVVLNGLHMPHPALLHAAAAIVSKITSYALSAYDAATVGLTSTAVRGASGGVGRHRRRDIQQVQDQAMAVWLWLHQHYQF